MRQLDITLEVNYMSLCHYIFPPYMSWGQMGRDCSKYETWKPRTQVQVRPVGVETLMPTHGCVPGTDLPKKRQGCYLTEAWKPLDWSINYDISYGWTHLIMPAWTMQRFRLQGCSVCWFNLYFAISILANTKRCQKKASRAALCHGRPCLGLLSCAYWAFSSPFLRTMALVFLLAWDSTLKQSLRCFCFLGDLLYCFICIVSINAASTKQI